MTGSSTRKTTIAAFATQGSGGDDEARLRALLAAFEVQWLPFRNGSRATKLSSFLGIVKELARRRPGLVVMEGSGIGGGLALLLARLIFRTRYVVSSGDAIAPFVAAQAPWAAPPFALYEWLLYRCSAGFIGWTPYLTGRALGSGARRAMTAPGWAPSPLDPEQRERERLRIRARLGIPEDALVFGIAGSLAWNRRVGFGYGLEIVRAIRRSDRPDLHGLILGDGSGLERLKMEAGPELGKRIHLPGRVPRDEVPAYLAALDLASLPQSCDRVGSYRYTTKLSEYLAAGLPVVTGEIPLAYDLDGGWLWRVPGDAPWEDGYIDALARLLTGLEPAELGRKRGQVPAGSPVFEREAQVRRVTGFLRDLLR